MASGNTRLVFEFVHILLLNVVYTFSVPDEVNGLGANAFGITCISVSWKEPLALRGPPEDKAYFVTFISGEVSFTMDVGPNISVSLENVMPGLNYRVQVWMFVCVHMYVYIVCCISCLRLGIINSNGIGNG